MKSSGNEEVHERHVHMESLCRKERRLKQWKDTSSLGTGVGISWCETASTKQ